jgi:hypothetical protein
MLFCTQNSMKSAFGELETPPRSGEAVLFPLNPAGVAGKVAVVPQTDVICLINLAKRPRKAVPARSRLPVRASAVNIDQYVKFIFACGNHKGLAYHLRMFRLWKIQVQFLAVDRYFTASVPDIYPRYRGFPSACTQS